MILDTVEPHAGPERGASVEPRHRRMLPVLDLRIATPCSADWASMVGDDRVRHCALCDKDVFNFSAMTRSEVETVVIAKNGMLCARYYKRKDGTALLQDCQVGLRERRMKLKTVGLLVTITASAVTIVNVGDPPVPPSTTDVYALGGMNEPSPAVIEEEIDEEAEQRSSMGLEDGSSQGLFRMDRSIGHMPMEPTEIPCDAYADTIDLFASCAGLDPAPRNSVVDAYRGAAYAEWYGASDEERARLREACAAAKQVISPIVRSVCPE